MKGKVIIVTGANSGIGKAASIELAKEGNEVVMVCRNTDRGRKALEEVRHLSGNDSVKLMICDLSSFNSIRNFSVEFMKSHKRLDVLINNAGVIVPRKQKTQDGYELQFGVNHLGHFLLTNLLMDLLINSAPSRIINVTSGAHKVGKIHLEDINLTNNYTLWRAYSQSKLANVLFTYELAGRLKDKGVDVNCIYPGAVATNMGIDRETGFGTFITSLLKPFFQTPLEGAQTIIYLSNSSDLEGITGKYYYYKRAILSSRNSYDNDMAKKLWELSEELTGVKYNI